MSYSYSNNLIIDNLVSLVNTNLLPGKYSLWNILVQSNGGRGSPLLVIVTDAVNISLLPCLIFSITTFLPVFLYSLKSFVMSFSETGEYFSKFSFNFNTQKALLLVNFSLSKVYLSFIKSRY